MDSIEQKELPLNGRFVGDDVGVDEPDSFKNKNKEPVLKQAIHFPPVLTDLNEISEKPLDFMIDNDDDLSGGKIMAPCVIGPPNEKVDDLIAESSTGRDFKSINVFAVHSAGEMPTLLTNHKAIDGENEDLDVGKNLGDNKAVSCIGELTGCRTNDEMVIHFEEVSDISQTLEETANDSVGDLIKNDRSKKKSWWKKVLSSKMFNEKSAAKRQESKDSVYCGQDSIVYQIVEETEVNPPDLVSVKKNRFKRKWWCRRVSLPNACNVNYCIENLTANQTEEEAAVHLREKLKENVIVDQISLYGSAVRAVSHVYHSLTLEEVIAKFFW